MKLYGTPNNPLFQIPPYLDQKIIVFAKWNGDDLEFYGTNSTNTEPELLFLVSGKYMKNIMRNMPKETK